MGKEEEAAAAVESVLVAVETALMLVADVSRGRLPPDVSVVHEIIVFVAYPMPWFSVMIIGEEEALFELETRSRRRRCCCCWLVLLLVLLVLLSLLLLTEHVAKPRRKSF